jgi:peptidoglycan/LPS O-acetylase OafA/YrhL
VLLTACGPDLPGVLLGHPRPLLANGLLVPLFAILIYSLAEGGGLLARLLSLPTLVLLGEANYGIYILQIPVSYLLRQPPSIHRS